MNRSLGYCLVIGACFLSVQASADGYGPQGFQWHNGIPNPNVPNEKASAGAPDTYCYVANPEISWTGHGVADHSCFSTQHCEWLDNPNVGITHTNFRITFSVSGNGKACPYNQQFTANFPAGLTNLNALGQEGQLDVTFFFKSWSPGTSGLEKKIRFLVPSGNGPSDEFWVYY
jgi:hypothetical protein